MSDTQSKSVNVGGRTVEVNADGFSSDEHGTSIKGEASTRLFQLIALRRMLKLEIETGMRASRGRSPMQSAAALIGSSKRTRLGVYADLDKFIVETGGQSVALKDRK